MSTQIQSIIDCNKVLPQSFIIPKSGQYLYKIGLTHFRVGNSDKETKQHLYYRFFVVIIYVIFFIHSLIGLSVSNDKYGNVFVYNGDWAYNYPEVLNAVVSRAVKSLPVMSSRGIVSLVVTAQLCPATPEIAFYDQTDE
jgi:hypothetical protein